MAGGITLALVTAGPEPELPRSREIRLMTICPRTGSLSSELFRWRSSLWTVTEIVRCGVCARVECCGVCARAEGCGVCARVDRDGKDTLTDIGMADSKQQNITICNMELSINIQLWILHASQSKHFKGFCWCLLFLESTQYTAAICPTIIMWHPQNIKIFF